MSQAQAAAPSIGHYENFPVASWLCPPRLRPPIAAVYHFARTADDIADEGDAAAQHRLSDLAAFRADLLAIESGSAPSNRWPQVFAPLAEALREFNLPLGCLTDLLSAFEQDVAKTRDGTGYADRAELLDYCRRSANPVGRLLLHLYGIGDETTLALSDHVCTALQLINFWQDLSVDIPRGRYYLPAADCAAHGVDPRDLMALRQNAETTKLIAQEVEWASGTMQKGSKIVHRVPGRAGWELRAVVQGGLRILRKIETINFQTLRMRPTLGKADLPALLWRSVLM
ncbi:MAG: squalene synthase HpnC [Burkholderiales bacterium]